MFAKCRSDLNAIQHSHSSLGHTKFYNAVLKHAFGPCLVH